MRNCINKLFLFIVCIIVLASCKKLADPIVEEGQSVFYLNGLIDSLPWKAEAGKENYYMFTSTSLDSDNVKRFTGTLKQNCNDCFEGISISIRNIVAGEFPSDSVLPAGMYPFLGNQTELDAYNVNFKANANGTGVGNHQWDFGDGTNSLLENPQKLYYKPGNYQIKHTVTYSNGCSANLNYTIKIVAGAIQPKSLTLNLSSLDSLGVSFQTDTNAAFSLWDFGDGQTAQGNTVTHDYAVAGRYKVCLLQYLGNDTLERCTLSLTKGFNSCNSGFTHETMLEKVANPELGSVSITYTNKKGEAFSSFTPQDPEAFFLIEESKTYLPNENGKPTQQLQISAKCKLSNGSQSKTITLKGKVALGK